MPPTTGLTSEAARIVEAAEAFLSSVTAFDPVGATPVDCVRLSGTAARVEKAAEALRLFAAARAVEHGAHQDDGVADPVQWVARQGGTTGKDARQGLELARRLERHAGTKDALLAGTVSVAQAREIVRAEAEMPGNEGALLDLARRADLGQVRDAIREKMLASTPVDELHRRQVAARRFRHWRDALGMVCFNGALPPHSGVPLVNRIEREAARRYRDAKRSGRAGPFDAFAADALVSLTCPPTRARVPASEADQRSSGSRNGAPPGAAGSRTGAPPGAAGGTRGANVDLVIVCDLYAWRRGHAHDREPCHLIGGGPIPVEVARDLAQDAFLKAVLHDGKDIQKVRHFGRRYTAELRTALDLGPVPAFSGRACVKCKRVWGVQRDHRLPIASNGRTSIDNVKDLCYSCHLEKTEQDRRAGLLGPNAKARSSLGRSGVGPGPP